MVTEDIKMPSMIQERKFADRAGAGCAFSSYSSLPENLAEFQIIKVISEAGNEYSVGEYIISSGQNNNTHPLWRLMPQRNEFYDLDGEQTTVSPYPFAIFKSNNLPDVREQFQIATHEYDLKTSVFPEREANDQEEIEEAFLRGVQPINHQYKVLFTQEVELKTSELETWEPTFVFNPNLFDDDE